MKQILLDEIWPANSKFHKDQLKTLWEAGYCFTGWNEQVGLAEFIMCFPFHDVQNKTSTQQMTTALNYLLACTSHCQDFLPPPPKECTPMTAFALYNTLLLKGVIIQAVSCYCIKLHLKHSCIIHGRVLQKLHHFF